MGGHTYLYYSWIWTLNSPINPNYALYYTNALISIANHICKLYTDSELYYFGKCGLFTDWGLINGRDYNETMWYYRCHIGARCDSALLDVFSFEIGRYHYSRTWSPYYAV